MKFHKGQLIKLLMKVSQEMDMAEARIFRLHAQHRVLFHQLTTRGDQHRQFLYRQLLTQLIMMAQLQVIFLRRQLAPQLFPPRSILLVLTISMKFKINFQQYPTEFLHNKMAIGRLRQLLIVLPNLNVQCLNLSRHHLIP